MENEQTWLAELTWEQVIQLNVSLCTAQKFDCRLTPKADQAQTLWDKGHAGSMSLLAALDLCKRCNELRPFVFNCSSTFTSLGSGLVEPWASQLSSLEGHMLRQTTAHYVDGQVGRKELVDLLKFLQKRPLLPVERKAKSEAKIEAIPSAAPALPTVREHQPA